MAIELGDKVVRAGDARPGTNVTRARRVPGEVKYIHPTGVHRFGVQYPGRNVLAYYSEDELEVVS